MPKLESSNFRHTLVHLIGTLVLTGARRAEALKPPGRLGAPQLRLMDARSTEQLHTPPTPHLHPPPLAPSTFPPLAPSTFPHLHPPPLPPSLLPPLAMSACIDQRIKLIKQFNSCNYWWKKGISRVPKIDHGASQSLPTRPSEEDFCVALGNGLILCNVLNRVNPGAVHKVVDNVIPVQSTEAAAQSAIQYFENMRNFLMAVGKMKLLTFEASHLEGGSSNKVVDCILCLKGFYEWKQAGGIGVWRYGGTVRITSLPMESPFSSVASDSTDESVADSEASHCEHILDFLSLSSVISTEESRAANALAFLFDHFGVGLILAYLNEQNGIADFPLNATVIDTVLMKVVKEFSALLVSQSNQLGVLLKKLSKDENASLSKDEFTKALSQYLDRRTNLLSSDFSKFCTCGGKRETFKHSLTASGHKLLNLHKEQLEELKGFFEETKQEVRQVQSDWENDIGRLESRVMSFEFTSSSYQKVLEENRLLYNQVQDLKGTVRVYCRVRPFLPSQSDVQSTVEHIGDDNIMIVNPLKQGKDTRRVFTFNKVFSANVTQEQIYNDTRPLIRSVLDGYNVCIFAYGQTGSGKTYTMAGSDLTTEETWGVNYRALSDLFDIARARKDIIQYEVRVQMIEIYNEQVRDLLVSDGSNRRLDIRNSSQLNGLNVPDASLISVTCTQDVLDLMKIGQRNRAVGATALNVRSSRSHSVLTVHIRGNDLVSASILKGCLHLADLAGSERVDKSEAVGERLKEAQHINRSLSALGDVISSLAQKNAHIPYRNSKLTQVLQDSLGGQAKTLMFVHINPDINAIGETISTLKFAERVASIDLGAARSNKESGELRELKEEISNMKLSMEKKEAELEQLRGGNFKGGIDSQNPRAASPFRMPKYGHGAIPKPDTPQRLMDGPKCSEARSSSSGKLRRARLSSSFVEESLPKNSSVTHGRSGSSAKLRSLSPPARRSVSTDRGTHIRSRARAEVTDNQPVARIPFPARIPVNKSVASPSVIASTDDYLRGYIGSLQTAKPGNASDALYNLQRADVNSRKVLSGHDDEQFKRALNVRQGAIRNSKTDAKTKIKSQIPVILQKADIESVSQSDLSCDGKVEEVRRTVYAELDNKQKVLHHRNLLR